MKMPFSLIVLLNFSAPAFGCDLSSTSIRAALKDHCARLEKSENVRAKIFVGVTFLKGNREMTTLYSATVNNGDQSIVHVGQVLPLVEFGSTKARCRKDNGPKSSNL